MNAIATIIDQVLAMYRDDAAAGRAVGEALASAARAGLIGLTRQQRDLVAVLSGDAGRNSGRLLVGVVREEFGFLVRMLDPVFTSHYPTVRADGKTFAWADAKKKPETFTWYLAAVLASSPGSGRPIIERLTEGLPAYAADGAGCRCLEPCDCPVYPDIPVVYGQEPVSTSLIILAILTALPALFTFGAAVATGAVTLIVLSYPDWKGYVFPPAPVPGSGSSQSASQDEKSDSGAALLILIVVFFFLG